MRTIKLTGIPYNDEYYQAVIEGELNYTVDYLVGEFWGSSVEEKIYETEVDDIEIISILNDFGEDIELSKKDENNIIEIIKDVDDLVANAIIEGLDSVEYV